MKKIIAVFFLALAIQGQIHAAIIVSPKNRVLATFVKKGNITGVKNLLKNGANVNFRGPFKTTPLHIAVQANNEKMVKLLLEKGAYALARNRFGKTPLDIAKKESIKKMLREAAIASINE